jgi:hypothetical protein
MSFSASTKKPSRFNSTPTQRTTACTKIVDTLLSWFGKSPKPRKNFRKAIGTEVLERRSLLTSYAYVAGDTALVLLDSANNYVDAWQTDTHVFVRAHGIGLQFQSGSYFQMLCSGRIFQATISV